MVSRYSPGVCPPVLRAHTTFSVVDMMAAGVLLIDALSSGLLGIASLLPDNLQVAGGVEYTVTFLHAVMILGESSLLSLGNERVHRDSSTVMTKETDESCDRYFKLLEKDPRQITANILG